MATDTAAPHGIISAPDIKISGTTVETIKVVYTDDFALAANTIDVADLRVTGPSGATCQKCAFYGYREMEKKCTKYREMVHEWGANIRKTQSACKYFEEKK